jgi:hypothetical protein
MAGIYRIQAFLSSLAILTAVLAAGREATAQNAGQPPAQIKGKPGVNAALFPGGNILAPGGLQGGAPGPGNNGNQGGSAQADFDSLIDLITSTVEHDSWLENGTGQGEISPFAINGVYVDAAGALRMRSQAGAASTGSLTAARQRGLRADEGKGASTVGAAKPQAANDGGELLVRRASALRYVSLPRLEAAIADCQRRHVPLESSMLTLAGLQRVSYVLVYPETGDLVLAGPAGDWDAVPGGGLVSMDAKRPVVRLDDLLALWRRQKAEKSAAFGCSIIPRHEALARTQEFLTASAVTPLEPSERSQWLKALRDAVGLQDVQYYHVDPDTRIGGLLLAADYHMKLIGMGLAPGVPGVRSYLDTVKLDSSGKAPAMSVLRWWFSMPTSTVEASETHDAFALPTRCVQVLSENELLAARGEQVHTGQSEDLNRAFAESFTKYFPGLADKYPVYGELERVFELALALALIEREGLTEKIGWSPSLLLDPERLRLPKSTSPRTVETVINHRVIGGSQIVAGVSGGVWIDGGRSLSLTPISTTSAGKLAMLKRAPEEKSKNLTWWWD